MIHKICITATEIIHFLNWRDNNADVIYVHNVFFYSIRSQTNCMIYVR